MTSTRTASATRHKIAATVVGLAGVMLALTGCGGQSVDGEYWSHSQVGVHSDNESARVVIAGSSIELYLIECVSDQPTIAEEPTMVGEVNDDHTQITLPDEDAPTPISIADGVLTVGDETYTQMTDAEGLDSSRVCENDGTY